MMGHNRSTARWFLGLSVWPVLFSAALVWAADATPPLRPNDLDKMFVPPQPTVLRFTTMASLTEDVPYTIRDYWQRETQSGSGQVVGEFVEIQVDLPRGFYEIDMPSLEQRFGLVVIEPAAASDPFFCIDAALSWGLRDDLRGAFIKILRRSGISLARERLGWEAICSSRDNWNWETAARYGTLRNRYREAGVGVLEMSHDAPRWLGRVGKYPEQLPGAAAAWQQIARQWQASWGAVEVWNEPDISFGDFLPADQYLALLKTIAYAEQQEHVEKPLVGGAVAGYNREFLDVAARNGLLDLIDAFSFHTYDRAEKMESLVGQYRDWLSAHRRPSMPLWITECGRPWKRGPARPPQSDDAVSALDISAKAIEALACGVARHFAFVYPYYEEQNQNFGMMGRENTPLRSMAAYCAAAKYLAGKKYLGDIKPADDKIRRLRVFGDQRESIAVAYTGQVDAGATVSLDLPVQRAAGIDGRELTVTDGRTPVPDGLTYLWLDAEQLSGKLESETAAMRLNRAAGQAVPPRNAAAPVVLRFQIDPDCVTPSSAGYTVKTARIAALPLVVRAFNLSEQPVSLRLVAGAARFGVRWLGSQQQSVEIKAQSRADAKWRIDLSAVLSESESVRIFVRPEGLSSGRIVPISIDLLGQPNLKQLLARYPRQVLLPVEQVDRWQPSVSPQGAMKIAPAADGTCRLVASFASENRWVYPRFSLPEGLDLRNYEGLVLEARSERPGTVRVMLWEGDKDVCYLTTQSIIPADGNWHAAAVRFQDLSASTANAPDLNARLDLDKVRRISIGMNSDSSESALEFRQVHLVGK